jgi:hypothetical protein
MGDKPPASMAHAANQTLDRFQMLHVFMANPA